MWIFFHAGPKIGPIVGCLCCGCMRKDRLSSILGA